MEVRHRFVRTDGRTDGRMGKGREWIAKDLELRSYLSITPPLFPSLPIHPRHFFPSFPRAPCMAPRRKKKDTRFPPVNEPSIRSAPEIRAQANQNLLRHKTPEQERGEKKTTAPRKYRWCPSNVGDSIGMVWYGRNYIPISPLGKVSKREGIRRR